MTIRKIIATLLCVFLLLPASVVLEAAETPALPGVDWTFENGGKGWDARNPWDPQLGVVNEAQYINFSYNENEDNVHGGEKALRLSNDGVKGYGSSSVSLTLHRSLMQQNRSLTLEGFVKVEDLGIDSTVNINWYFGGGWKNSVSVASFSAEDDWKKFAFAPYWWDGDTYDYSYLSLTLTGTGTVYFDDLSLTYSDNMVQNSSFENFGGAEAASPVGWSVNKNNISWGVDYKISEEDGNHYLEAYNRGNSAWGFLYQPISGGLTPGDPYIVSVKYKGSQNNLSPAISIGTVTSGNYTKTIDLSAKFTTEDTGDGWKTYTASFTAPEEPFAANILIDYANGWYQSALYDDLALICDGEMPALPKFVEGVPSLRETFEQKEAIYTDKNFGFEKGSEEWSVYQGYGVENESIFVQNGVKHSGENALMLKNDGIIDTQSVVYIRIPKPADGIGVINISGQLRLDSIKEDDLYNSDPLLSDNKGVGVKVAVYYGEISPNRVLAYDAVNVADESWYKFDFPIITTANEDMVLAIWLYGAGTAYADSIEVNKTNNLLLNGSFDEAANGGTTVQGIYTRSARGAWGTNVFCETENTFSGNALRLDGGVWGTPSYCTWLYVYEVIRELNAMPAGDYTMTVALRDATTPGIQFSSLDGLDNSPQTVIPEFEPVRVNGEWTEYMAHFTIPAEMTVKSMVIVGGGIYDELFLTRTGNLPPVLSCDGGNAFTEVKPGSYITANAEITDADAVTLALCIYSETENGKVLEAIDFVSGTDITEKTEMKVKVRVPQDDGKTYSAESFLWENGMRPLY